MSLMQAATSLAGQRDQIRKMSPDKAMKLADFIWRRTVMPRQQMNFRSDEDKEAARKQFLISYLGLAADAKLPEGFGRPEVKPGVGEKAAAGLAGAGAGVAGGIGNVAEMLGKGMGALESKPSLKEKDVKAGKDIKNVISKYIEGPAYEYAKEVSPDIARYSAGAGKTIPSVIAAEAVLPAVPAIPGGSLLAKAGTHALRGGVAGAAGMVPFSTDPREIGKGAIYGAALEPIVGGITGARRPKGVTAAKAPAVAASSATGGVQDLFEQVAKQKFGKSVGELTDAERVQAVAGVRTRLAEQQQQLDKAAKIVAKPTAKPKVTAEQAKAKAKAQAKARVSGSPMPDPGAQASTTVSPQAKAPQKTGEGVAAARMVEQPPSTNASQEMMSKAHESERLRAVLANPQATAEEKNYAKTILEGEQKLAAENQAEAQRLAQAKMQNTIAAAKAQTPEMSKVVAAMKDFAGEPAVTKVPEGEHGTGPLGKRAKNAERKAAERSKAASEQPSSGVITDAEGGLAKKMVRQSISETPTVELEGDFKMVSPESFKILQSIRKKQKWDDEVYRGYLMEWFTRIIQEKSGK